MKRTLIISDIHLRWKLVDNIINEESPDEIIFLGDYFDDFGDTPEKNLVMAESIKQETFYCCLGHAKHYEPGLTPVFYKRLFLDSP